MRYSMRHKTQDEPSLKKSLTRRGNTWCVCVNLSHERAITLFSGGYSENVKYNTPDTEQDSIIFKNSRNDVPPIRSWNGYAQEATGLQVISCVPPVEQRLRWAYSALYPQLSSKKYANHN